MSQLKMCKKYYLQNIAKNLMDAIFTMFLLSTKVLFTVCSGSTSQQQVNQLIKK